MNVFIPIIALGSLALVGIDQKDPPKATPSEKSDFNKGVEALERTSKDPDKKTNDSDRRQQSEAQKELERQNNPK